MERPTYNINEQIEYNRQLAAEEPAGETRWFLERRAAQYEFQRSVKDHYASLGHDFFDHRQWKLDCAWASLQHKEALDRYRRRMGDCEILQRLADLSQGRRIAESGYKVTAARRKVIEALVRLVSKSSVLYCSYASLAREAGVSARTAHTMRAELEHVGVLARIRTGGKAADGSRQTNKYIVSWQRLRALLDIESKWGSRRRSVVEPHWYRPNVYYNYEGYAHYSRTARQIRRIKQRIRELMEARAQKRAEAVEKAMHNLAAALPSYVEKSENEASDQAICTVTTLKTLKSPKIFQPRRSPLSYQGPDVENGTRQSRSYDRHPADGTENALLRSPGYRRTPSDEGKFSFDPALFPNDLAYRASRVSTRRLMPLLHEVEVMVQQHHDFFAEPSAQTHAEQILDALIDADRTLFY